MLGLFNIFGLYYFIIVCDCWIHPYVCLIGYGSNHNPLTMKALGGFFYKSLRWQSKVSSSTREINEGFCHGFRPEFLLLQPYIKLGRGIVHSGLEIEKQCNHLFVPKKTLITLLFENICIYTLYIFILLSTEHAYIDLQYCIIRFCKMFF